MLNNSQRMWIGALCALALTGQLAVRADEKQEAAKPDEKPVTLAQVLKVGDTVRYKYNLVVSTSGGEANVESSEKHTVKEIKDNKDTVILVEDEGTKLDAGGMGQEYPGGPPVTLTVDKSNKTLSYKPKEEGTSPFATPTRHLLALVDRNVFPDKPVKPGDSWTTEVDNPAIKDKKVKIKSTYIGMDKVEGKPAWKVKQTLEADAEGDSKLTAESTTLLDASNGQLLESEQTVAGVPSQFGTMSWKGKIQRIKTDADKEKKPVSP